MSDERLQQLKNLIEDQAIEALRTDLRDHFQKLQAPESTIHAIDAITLRLDENNLRSTLDPSTPAALNIVAEVPENVRDALRKRGANNPDEFLQNIIIRPSVRSVIIGDFPKLEPMVEIQPPAQARTAEPAQEISSEDIVETTDVPTVSADTPPPLPNSSEAARWKGIHAELESIDGDEPHGLDSTTTLASPATSPLWPTGLLAAIADEIELDRNHRAEMFARDRDWQEEGPTIVSEEEKRRTTGAGLTEPPPILPRDDAQAPDQQQTRAVPPPLPRTAYRDGMLPSDAERPINQPPAEDAPEPTATQDEATQAEPNSKIRGRIGAPVEFPWQEKDGMFIPIQLPNNMTNQDVDATRNAVAQAVAKTYGDGLKPQDVDVQTARVKRNGKDFTLLMVEPPKDRGLRRKMIGLLEDQQGLVLREGAKDAIMALPSASPKRMSLAGTSPLNSRNIETNANDDTVIALEFDSFTAQDVGLGGKRTNHGMMESVKKTAAFLQRVVPDVDRDDIAVTMPNNDDSNSKLRIEILTDALNAEKQIAALNREITMDQWTHKNAGKEVASARTQPQGMIKSGAATELATVGLMGVAAFSAGAALVGVASTTLAIPVVATAGLASVAAAVGAISRNNEKYLNSPVEDARTSLIGTALAGGRGKDGEALEGFQALGAGMRLAAGAAISAAAERFDLAGGRAQKIGLVTAAISTVGMAAGAVATGGTLAAMALSAAAVGTAVKAVSRATGYKEEPEATKDEVQPNARGSRVGQSLNKWQSRTRKGNNPTPNPSR